MPDVSKNSVTRATIGEDEQGQRLDNYLLRVCKGVPKSHIYRILRSGEVRVNSKRADAAYRIQAGDILRIPPIRVAARPDEVAARLAAGERFDVAPTPSTRRFADPRTMPSPDRSRALDEDDVYVPLTEEDEIGE